MLIMSANNTNFTKRQAEILFYRKHGEFVSRQLYQLELDLSCYKCVDINPTNTEITIEIRMAWSDSSPLIGIITLKTDHIMDYSNNEKLYCRLTYDDPGRVYIAKDYYGNVYTLSTDAEP